MSGGIRNTGFERFASLFGSPLGTNLLSLSGLVYPGATAFVKMTAAGTFGLDVNTYLTAEADTLATVTGRGASTAVLSTFSSGLIVPYIRPAADSTTAFQFQKADGTNIFNIDSTNNQVGIGTNSPNTYMGGTFGLAIRHGTLPGLALSNSLRSWLLYGSGANLFFYNDGTGGVLGMHASTGFARFGDLSAAACRVDVVGSIRASINMHLTGSGYLYLNETSISADTVNDIRLYNTAGTFTIQKCTVASGTKSGGTWAIGKIQADYRSVDGSDGLSVTQTVVTDVRDNAGQMQKRTQVLTYKNGILTGQAAESAWTDTTDI